MTAQPLLPGKTQTWVQGTGQDTARYTVDPGYVKSDTQKSPGMLRHVRPHLSNGQLIFVFPVGVEGFRITGQAQLGIHHYLGANTVDANTLHREEGRIELTGTFAGISGQANMVALRSVLMSQAPIRGMSLFASGVFQAEQLVLPENWEFDHAADDQTHSISYTVSFLRIGTGKQLSDPAGRPPPPQPGTKKNDKGKARIFVVRSGFRTLRQIAKKVYGNPDKWVKLVDLNAEHISNLIPSYQMPTVVWPIGTKFKY